MFNRKQRNAADGDPRHALGRAGEALAAEWLCGHGLKLIAHSFSTPVGELDLICRDGQTIVFVEVKTRRDRVHADPEDAVGGRKQRRSLRAARWYLHEKGWEERPCRFDVVTLILPPTGAPEIRHFADAFAP